MTYTDKHTTSGRDTAYPKLNAASKWFWSVGATAAFGAVISAAIFVPSNPKVSMTLHYPNNKDKYANEMGDMYKYGQTNPWKMNADDLQQLVSNRSGRKSRLYIGDQGDYLAVPRGVEINGSTDAVIFVSGKCVGSATSSDTETASTAEICAEAEAQRPLHTAGTSAHPVTADR